jgi:Tol biopolymer transport system component
MKQPFKRSFVLIAFLFTVTACGGGGDNQPTEDSSSAARTTKLSASDTDCPNGGILVETGIDENGNGILDDNEVDSAEKVCHGVNGLTALLNMSDEAAGPNCEFGGTRIETGIDDNGDGVLQIEEVSETRFICALSTGDFDGLLYLADTIIDGMQELFRTDKDSATASKLIGPRSASGNVDNFALSPDHSHVAVYGDLETAGVKELFVLSLVDGSAPIKVSGPLVSGGHVTDDYRWSPDGSHLAYRADQDAINEFELYTVAVDGTGNLKVSDTMAIGGDVSANGFEWSADGSFLAYLADQSTDGVVELYTVTNDGLDKIKVSGALAAGGNVDSFQWSPDNLTLAFRADKDTDEMFELYTVAANGFLLIRVSGSLIAGGDVGANFNWSPNGNYLAYTADGDADNVFDLFTTHYNGGARVKVSGPMVAGGIVWTYSWSPDSNHLAYRADQQVDNVYELYSVQPDGTGNVKVSGALVNGGDVAHFQWSPDGTHLAYSADQDIDGMIELYTVQPDGTGNVKVSDASVAGGNVDNIHWSWSPDSSLLAYRADQDTPKVFELYTTQVDGTGNVKVSGLLTPGGNIEAFEWSPDSSRLAYISDQDNDEVFELYTVQPDGTDNVKVSGVLSAEEGDNSVFAWSAP